MLKLVNLSEKVLKNMVVQYSELDRDMFDFDFFKNLYPEESDDFLIKSLLLLEDNNFVSIFYADNVPYFITLLPDGIVNVDENTFVRKGYTLIKEIKSLLL